MRLTQHTASSTEDRHSADTTRVLVIGSLLTAATVSISTAAMAWLVFGGGMPILGLAVSFVLWLAAFVLMRMRAPSYAIFVTLALPFLLVTTILVWGYAAFGGM